MEKQIRHLVSLALRAAPREVTPAELQQIAREAYFYAYSPVYAYRFLQDEVFNEKSRTPVPVKLVAK